MNRPALAPMLLGALLLPPAAPAGAQDPAAPPVQGRTATAPPVPPVTLTPAQIETVLRARGYDRLEGLAREDSGHYRLEGAMRFGERVGPLRIEAMTGQVLDEPPLTEAQLRALLRARGYEEVPEIRPAGPAVFVRARREGTEVALRVDPRSGVVRPWRD